MSIRTFLFLFGLIAILNAQKFRYDNYQLIRVFPTTQQHVKLIEQLESNDNKFDIWSSIRGESFDILVSPDSLTKYSTLFRSNNINYSILENNIQNKIEEQQRSMSNRASSIINKYARYSEISSFIDQIAQDNSDISSTYIAGKSSENRLLKVIVLKPFSTSTRSLWIDCGIHAREWVSPATCVYTIDRLIKEFRANDPKIIEIFKKYEIHIMPLLNPDGYEYSHTTMRLWRKTRKINYYASCPGVDLNRNFAYKWFTGGASLSPCAETYCGETAESEPETLAVVNSLRNKTGKWDAYLSLHSYGNWWLTPYGYILSSKLKPDNYDKMVEKGKIGAAAIKQLYNETFVVGASSDLLYINSGSSKDWAYGELKIPYSYVLELRPGSKSPDSKYGFTLPEDRMPFVSEETYAGIKEFFYSII